MKVRPLWLALSVLAPSLPGAVASPAPGAEPRGLAARVDAPAYVGRYRLDPDRVLVVRHEDGLLTLLPSFWRTAQILEPVAEDRFRSLLHPEMGFAFHRDEAGSVRELEVSGNDEIEGVAVRMAAGERLPVEALLAGDAAAALELLPTEEKAAGDEERQAQRQRALRLAIQLLWNFPSRGATAVAFLEALAQRHPDAADVHAALGGARVRAGERQRARAAFRRALELDPENAWATSALGVLEPPPAGAPAAGWRLPFELAGLFRPPAAAEVAAVRADWEKRDLAPRDVRQVRRTTLETPAGSFQVRLLSHRVHGELHYAAVLVPEGATPGCCPVLLDVRGVSWNFEPRRLSAELRTIQILRGDASRFVIAVPGLRGEVLEVGGTAYTSEGDRTNGWDGATDDTLALLSVVLETIPEAAPDRACVYGKSRGATVAMLAAARDPRLDCAVAWAGPSDWFRLMGTWGWTLEELVGEGLREKWRPGQGTGSAGQFIESYLRRPIDEGEPGLAAVRRRVLAASPLYFAERLPPSDLHYGVEDRSVAVANGLALRDRLAELGRPAPDYRVVLHEGAGHDMPYPRAFDLSRDFLLRQLAGTASVVEPPAAPPAPEGGSQASERR